MSINRVYAEIKRDNPHQFLSSNFQRFSIEHKLFSEEGIGTSEKMRRPITVADKEFTEMNNRVSETISSLKLGRIPIGGDFVRLDVDTVLVLCQMIAGKEWVDTAIHLRQPSSFPDLLSLVHIDELLYYEKQIH